MTPRPTRPAPRPGVTVAELSAFATGCGRAGGSSRTFQLGYRSNGLRVVSPAVVEKSLTLRVASW